MAEKTEVLKDAPKYLRAAKSTGSQSAIDRTGGFRDAGLIEGVSVITEGEALGHDFWIDNQFNTQVAAAINSRDKGVKSRFTHPGLSGDGLGKLAGRVMSAEVEGNRVVAEQHFTQSGHKTPDGDLAGYLMDLAEESPADYGLSIVFMHDVGEMDRFAAEHTDEKGAFISPDPLNVNNYPHSRLGELMAVDAVDEPAANPGGLFHRDQEIAQEATAVMSFALGLTEQAPTVASLGLDASRVKRFVADFLDTNNLTIGDKKMAEPQETAAEVTTDDAQLSDATTDETQTFEEVATAVELSQGTEKTGADYLEAFGDQGGVWFAQGKPFDLCLALQNQKQQEEIEGLKSRLSTPAETGEESAVKFNADGNTPARKGFANKLREMNAK